MSHTYNAEDGVNIKVVLRCRPMTKAESMKDRAVINCVSDKVVEVNYASMGKQAKKGFTFDGVFDAASTQTEVYDGVVRPVVDEVLQGYNCTVFAYGQTGTGKTHTMEGDVSPGPAGVTKDAAGIIPRAVTQVFEYLESNGFEYTVRISVVELYNEELADLIASSDDGSIAGNLRKLRLMEDPKKGIVLQGVEERAVKDVKDIFNLLETTNKQIFTLKIFMKEQTIEAEEIIKTGTLNLVDLAGSECVGRSGAQGDRKKEAGQINQSLLTLGRVITALVEHQPHIPYRESKLTRLLQESLGGKTKTCIIATVSPNSANIEETLGTLDYACRAKNIKNTPEINQVQTKKTMMRDMSKYIADLQNQLKAQRDGAGVYLPTDKYEEMQEELKRLGEAEAVLQAEIDEKMKQLLEWQEAFEDTKNKLEDTRADLSHTQGVLSETEASLRQTKVELHQTHEQLEDTTQVLKEHKAVGEELYKEGSTVLSTATAMKRDIGGLFGKIARKVDVAAANDDVANLYTTELYQQVDEAGRELQSFSEQQTAKLKQLQRLVAEMVVEKNEEVAALKLALAQMMEANKTAMTEQASRVDAAAELSNQAQQDLALLASEHRSAQVALVKGLSDEVESTATATATALEETRSSVTGWAATMLAGLDDSAQQVESFVSAQQAALASIVAQVEADARARESALAADRKALDALVEEQAEASIAMKASLMNDFEAMMAAAFDKHQQSMSGKVSAVCESLAATEEAITCSQVATSSALSASVQAVRTLGQEAAARVHEQRADNEGAKNEVAKKVAEVTALTQAASAAVSECREASYALSETQASAAAASVDSTVQGTRQVSSSTCEAMQGEMALAAAAGDALEQQLQDCDTSAGARGEALAAAVGEQEEAVAQYALAAQAQLGYIRAHELKLRQDEVTGSTPMKKDFELPPALPAFRRDSEVIAEFRGHPLPEMSSTSPLELEATTVTVDAESAQDSPLAHEMEDPVAPDDSKAAAETSAAAEMEAAAAAQEEAAEAERAQAAAAAAAAAQKQKQQEEDAAAAAAEKAEKAAVVPRLAAKTNNTAREIQAPKVRSARGAASKEPVSSKAPSRIPSARGLRGKENTSN